MTPKESYEVKKLVDGIFDDDLPPWNIKKAIVRGVIAGRESMRAESDAAYTDEHNRAECFRRGCADLRDQLKAERERSAKLIERIRKCMKDEEFITKLGCELLSAFIHVYVYGEHDADVAGARRKGD